MPDRRQIDAEELERLRRENEQLRRQVAEQAKHIAELKRQLAMRQQNSTTTSKPPSSDGLAGQQRVRTCQLQQLSALVYLSAAMRRASSASGVPSLLRGAQTP